MDVENIPHTKNGNSLEASTMDEMEKKIIMDCKVMLNKLGNIPFDKAYHDMQKDLWNIGTNYGLTGPQVFHILMENFPKEDE